MNLVDELPRPAPAPVKRLALTREQAAVALGICTKTLDGLIRKGELASAIIGGRRLIPVDVLESFIRSRIVGRETVVRQTPDSRKNG